MITYRPRDQDDMKTAIDIFLDHMTSEKVTKFIITYAAGLCTIETDVDLSVATLEHFGVEKTIPLDKPI